MEYKVTNCSPGFEEEEGPGVPECGSLQKLEKETNGSFWGLQRVQSPADTSILDKTQVGLLTYRV